MGTPRAQSPERIQPWLRGHPRRPGGVTAVAALAAVEALVMGALGLSLLGFAQPPPPDAVGGLGPERFGGLILLAAAVFPGLLAWGNLRLEPWARPATVAFHGLSALAALVAVLVPGGGLGDAVGVAVGAAVVWYFQTDGVKSAFSA